MANTKKYAHLVGSFVSVVVILVVFSSSLGPLPPLGNFLNPTGGGILDVGKTANNPTMEELTVSNSSLLKSNVTIYRDAQDIPHIYATYDRDMFFAVGYVQAQDRLFQMDIQRRLLSGTLSEILGNVTLDSDIHFRSVGLERSAQEVYNALLKNATVDHDPKSIKLIDGLNSYADGVNFYIDHNHPLPFEFQLLGYKPTHWSPVDSVAFGKYMSYYLAFGEGDNDLQFTQIVQHLGATKAYELFPTTEPFQIPVVPDYGGYQMPEKYSFTSKGSTSQAPMVKNSNQIITPKLEQAAQNVDNALQNIFTSIGPLLSKGIGSNNYVVSGNKTISGHPILANDMHLSWQTPAIWYQISYHSKESGFNDWGFSFVGVPLVVAGHNKNVAWGYTNVGGDVFDWFYYNTNGDQYLRDGQWLNYKITYEDIKVKGSPDFNLTVKSTLDGPIIPGTNYTYNGMSLVASWTGIKTYEQLGEKAVFKAIYDFNLAQNYTEFKNAVYEWDGPSQNIIYADSSNIAIWVAGEIPLRGSGDPNNGRLPVNGSVLNSTWVGYVPAVDWPHSLNPAQNYLASANQKSTGPNYPYYIGSYYANGYRARRINYLLDTSSKIDVTAMEKIQTDVLDTSAEAFVPYLLDAIANHSSSFNIPASVASSWDSVVNSLKNWNYYMFANETQPLIYSFFLYYYIHNVFGDEYKQNGLSSDTMLPPLNYLDYLTWNTVVNGSSSSTWFDNVSTSNVVENVYDMLLQSFSNAIKTLQDDYGTNVNKWIYGTWHQGTFDSLTQLLALSPAHVPIYGSDFTLNAAYTGFLTNLDGHATVGSSERAIYDLNNLSNSVAALPGGQSGNPVSPHYHDLLDKYFLPWNYYSQLFFSDRLPQQYVASTLILRSSK